MSKGIIFRDCKTGADFENRVVTYLSILGFMANKTGRNDGGIDIVAAKTIHENEYKFYIQCKYFNTTLGKHPIQEVFAGAHYYKEGSGKGTPVVITNNAVTREARLYAKRLGVEIIADAEWQEIKEVTNSGEVTNPNQRHGLMGLIISKILEVLKNQQADEYLAASLAEPAYNEEPADNEELILKVMDDFDEAEEDIKESAHLYQKAAQLQQKGLNKHRDAIIRHLKYG